MSFTWKHAALRQQRPERTLYVDNALGDDANARRGQPTPPFKSIRAANKASKPGDLISIAFGTGEYREPVGLGILACRDYEIAGGVVLEIVPIDEGRA
jgi:hypothetical protein